VEAQVEDRLARCLGSKPINYRPVARGYTGQHRWLIELAQGRSVFVKSAIDDETAGWLRAEYHMYSHLDAPFVPTLVGWDDDGRLPILAIEDLSACMWPPPWSREGVDAVLATLTEVAATPPPPGLPSAESLRDELAGWRKVVEDPAPFLELGLCALDWLERSLPTLIAASGEAVLDGDALLHFDVRSDNICICKGRAMLVDWNSAVLEIRWSMSRLGFPVFVSTAAQSPRRSCRKAPAKSPPC
jgi:hypothetical protein